MLVAFFCGILSDSNDSVLCLLGRIKKSVQKDAYGAHHDSHADEHSRYDEGCRHPVSLLKGRSSNPVKEGGSAKEEGEGEGQQDYSLEYFGIQNRNFICAIGRSTKVKVRMLAKRVPAMNVGITQATGSRASHRLKTGRWRR